MTGGKTNNALRWNSIGRRLIVSIMLFSSVVTLLSTAVQLYLEYRRDLGALEANWRHIDHSYVKSISAGLWSFNQRMIQVQLEGILDLPDVQYLELADEGKLAMAVGTPPVGETVERLFPLTYRYRGVDQDLGTLRVVAGLDGVYHRLGERVVIILLTQGVKTFLVSAFIFYLFYLLVGRRLRIVAGYVRSLRPDSLGTPLPAGVSKRSAGDELDVVAAAIDEMRELLRQDIARRRQIEAELRVANDRYRILLQQNRDRAEKLHESERRLEQIARQSRTMIWEIDAEGCFTFISPIVEEMIGYRPGEIVGRRHFYDLHPEEGREEFRAAAFEAFARKEAFRDHENPIQTRTGEIVWVATSGLPLLHEDGSLRGYRGCDVDITRRKQADAALQQKNEELKHYLYTVSHDLKSPLVTINSFLTLLREDIETGNAEQIPTDIRYLEEAAGKMDQILGLLLNLSRVGRIGNPSQTLAVGKVVDECLSLLAGPISLRNIVVDVAAMPKQLHGDPLRLRQIWQNLIENAVKYMGDQPHPRIEIGCEGNGDEHVFFVRDNGMGICREDLERIFVLFVQVNPCDEGSGLGLALVKKIVEVYHGRIWVESAGVGQGSCFRFTLPAAGREGGRWEKQETSPAEVPAAEDPSGF